MTARFFPRGLFPRLEELGTTGAADPRDVLGLRLVRGGIFGEALRPTRPTPHLALRLATIIVRVKNGIVGLAMTLAGFFALFLTAGRLLLLQSE